MKALSIQAFAFAIGLSLAGCCPNGCFVLTGEAYRRAAYPKPYLHKWEKQGATPEDRMQTSFDCGGVYTDHPGFGESRIAQERLTGEDFADTYARLFRAYERCLAAKGYHFTGECYDNEISRKSPACGAP